MVEKTFAESIINDCRNRENEPFVNAVVKLHNLDTFIKSNDQKESNQSVKKILLFYLWQETTKDVFSKLSGAKTNYQNINDPGDCTLNEIFIQS